MSLACGGQCCQVCALVADETTVVCLSLVSPLLNDAPAPPMRSLRTPFHLPRIVRQRSRTMEVLVVCPRPRGESVAPRRTADGTTPAAKSSIASWRLGGALRNIAGIPSEIMSSWAIGAARVRRASANPSFLAYARETSTTHRCDSPSRFRVPRCTSLTTARSAPSRPSHVVAQRRGSRRSSANTTTSPPDASWIGSRTCAALRHPPVANPSSPQYHHRQ